jgi:hypothetical protein
VRCLLIALLVPVVVPVVVPVAAHADLRFAIGNDTLSGIVTRTPPYDDMGFTNDIDLAFWRPYREYLVGGEVFDRWITQDVPVGGLRRDVVDLVATVERTFGDVDTVTPSLRVGPSFTGNIGGRWGQDKFHRVCQCGRPLDEGLQNTYEGGNQVGLLVDARVRGAAGLPWIHGYSYLDGRASIGSGVSSFEFMTGAQLDLSYGRNRYGAHLELGVGRYHVSDDRFSFEGSYRPGWQAQRRFGVFYARGRVRADFEYRANEGGSGEPIGVVALTFKQAGHTF